MKCFIIALTTEITSPLEGSTESALTPVFTWSQWLCLLKSTTFCGGHNPKATFHSSFLWSLSNILQYRLLLALKLSFLSFHHSLPSHLSGYCLSVFSVVFSSYTHPLHIIISQGSVPFPFPRGDPTPYLFTFNHHLYVEITFISVSCCVFFSLRLQIHKNSSLLDTCTWVSHKHFKFNVSQRTLRITPHKTKGHNSVNSPTILLIYQDSPTPLTKSQCFYTSLKWILLFGPPSILQ